MPVFNARDGEVLQLQQVHVLPSSATLTICEGRLRLRRTGAADHERAPIDIFFESLAEDQRERAIGVVLSGGVNCRGKQLSAQSMTGFNVGS
jgi:two-component system, chemotaxis family, CheB/CheR fusion protein